MFSWIVSLLLSLNLMVAPISPDKGDSTDGPRIENNSNQPQQKVIVEDIMVY